MLPRSLLGSATALFLSLTSPASAQLYTACNPTLKDCPADPAFGTAHTFVFNSTPPTGLWNTSAGTVGYDAENGASFTISKKGYSPTLTSNFYFFWGRTEVIMKAANGTGIISSIVYGSDDLDEVDWEFRGVDTNIAQSNYYGKGVTNSTSGASHTVSGNIQSEWHNYTNVWTKDKLEWWIDGTLARTLLPAAANDSRNYPQTPMKLSMGIWAGGDSSQAAGTIEWAGGATDYDAGPYTMYVKSARVEDYSSGKEYVYGDRTGDYTSITITDPDSNSTAIDNLNNAATADDDESLSEKWDNLSSGAKAGVYAGAAGVVGLALAALLVYYFKQRRRGQQEAALYAANQERERLELEQFKKEGRNPDSLGYEGAEYNAATMSKTPVVSTAAYNIPDSRSNSLSNSSLHGPATTSDGWDPTSSGMGSPGARAAATVPLMQDSPQSPTYGNPSRNNSYGPMSPVHPQSPGGPPQFLLPASPGARNMSMPNPSMRMGSPGPQAGGYSAMDRTGSPGPMNRSFSSPRSPGGGDGYWNGGGHR
ncbi:hypothetical protein E8E14_011006 [Neopestalotiopsis sp. 37M]|nr:hypothetical protein E8E14_011006 [Neopestalotiopsis sp. 37M]